MSFLVVEVYDEIKVKETVSDIGKSPNEANDGRTVSQ